MSLSTSSGSRWANTLAVCSGVAAITALTGFAFGQTAYQFTTVDFPGTTYTQFYGINDTGNGVEIVGYGFDYSLATLTVSVPFRLNLTGGSSTFTSLPLLPGAAETQVAGINAAGTIVGGAFDGAGLESAFVLDEAGGFTVFSTPGWPNTEARAISATGLIVGTSYAPDEATKTSSVGFIYDPKQNTFTLVLPEVSQDVVPQGINASGQVVGSYVGPSGGKRAWLRAPSGDITTFSVNGSGTAARGINDSGQIAGFVTDPVSGHIKGFVTTLSGAPGFQAVSIPDAELIEYPGAIRTYLEGITNAGVIIGFWSDQPFPSQSYHGFIATPTKFQGLWWASPAMSEAGWGINLAHQGDTIFASWFTYNSTSKGWWLVMTAPKTSANTYSGALYTTTGPAFNSVPFNPAQVVPTQVGSGTLTFSDANNGTFTYSVNGTQQVKPITRQVFGTLPVCATATGSLTAATNYQDLWWASPAGSESGWGINLTHEADTIFATWFTYDLDGSPMWLVVTAPKTAPGVYSGTLYRTTGPPFNSLPFDPANVTPTAVGSATFTFSDGNNATFAYTVNGVAQNKAITREIFNAPGTVCN